MFNKVPEIVNDFNCYIDGTKLVGVSAEVTLPDFEATTETISGAGILGEYDAVNPGQFGAQEIEVPFRVLYGDVFKLFGGASVDLTLRGAIQIADGSGVRYPAGVRIIMRGQPKKLTGGSMSAGKPMSASVSIALTYIKVEVNGSTAVELDKLNGVYVVDGVDKLLAVKLLC